MSLTVRYELVHDKHIYSHSFCNATLKEGNKETILRRYDRENLNVNISESFNIKSIYMNILNDEHIHFLILALQRMKYLESIDICFDFYDVGVKIFEIVNECLKRKDDLFFINFKFTKLRKKKYITFIDILLTENMSVYPSIEASDYDVNKIYMLSVCQSISRYEHFNINKSILRNEHFMVDVIIRYMFGDTSKIGINLYERQKILYDFCSVLTYGFLCLLDKFM